MTRTRYRSDTGFFPTLDKAWRKLKKLKIYAQRGSCCRGCSSAEASDKLKEEGFENYLGVVHYNIQDRDAAMTDPEGGMYLGFFANTGEVEDMDETLHYNLTYAVAVIAKLHFEAHGFDVVWKGRTDRRMTLTLKKEETPGT